MRTRDRVIRFRLKDDFAGWRLHTLSSRRRAMEARRLMRTESTAHLVECNPLTVAAASEAVNRPSYACKLYAASAT